MSEQASLLDSPLSKNILLRKDPFQIDLKHFAKTKLACWLLLMPKAVGGIGSQPSLLYLSSSLSS